ncbi:hypothetical protein, partial [Cyanobacterium aponinum]
MSKLVVLNLGAGNLDNGFPNIIAQLRVNYYPTAIAESGASSFTGSCLKTDLRPPFGLTDPPDAETAVP